MTDSDKEFVRKWSGILNGAHYIDVIVRINGENRFFGGEEFKRLLTLLIESEAMREKAEHLRSCLARTLDTGIYCSRCFGSPNIKPWADRDWIFAVRKEIEG